MKVLKTIVFGVICVGAGMIIADVVTGGDVRDRLGDLVDGMKDNFLHKGADVGDAVVDVAQDIGDAVADAIDGVTI